MAEPQRKLPASDVGREDLKRIVFDTRMHKLDDAYWMKATYYDLLKGYLRYKNVTNDVSVEGALQDLGIPLEGTAHRALDDAKMTAHVFRAVFSSLDFSLSRHYKDVYSNAKERRYVKNALRDMKAKKLVPSWELFMEKYVKDKLSLEDPRKAAELQEYFAVLTEKVEQKVPDPAKEALAVAAPGAEPEEGDTVSTAPLEGERPEGSNPRIEAEADIGKPMPSPQTTERGEREE
ncbi:hypothetical protein N6H14_25310 [Paenibacillus sp. CC-CFT747]|nr:hypothetical protein N6H14_25310 [Paenibacillus sp. CC-CFT747]